MRYSTLLLAALPIVAALPAPLVTSMIYETITVTIDEFGSTITSVASSAVVLATATANDVTSSAEATAAPVAPVVNAVSVPTSASSSPATASVQSTSSGSSDGGCGCPGDSSAPVSPGLNGNPSKSVLDSANCIRRMYNSNAVCLQYSPSLASASQECANANSESFLRAASTIISDPSGYGGVPWFKGAAATTNFESSMFTMLCQNPDGDSHIQGLCQKVGEIGCEGGACDAHRLALIDASGQFKYMGIGINGGWLSASFSDKYSA